MLSPWWTNWPKKGVIHKNKAANLKSKLARRVNALAAAK